MPYDSDKIEPNEGLHHHGDEPHRPGYTLGELITLARSSNSQQASVAIQTIANVIKNERHGRFISCFDRKNILIELLEADLTSVLRIALDNHHSEVVRFYYLIVHLTSNLDNLFKFILYVFPKKRFLLLSYCNNFTFM